MFKFGLKENNFENDILEIGFFDKILLSWKNVASILDG